MSLHAEITDEARRRLHSQRRNSSIASMVIAFLVLVLIGLLLGFIFISPLLREIPVLVTFTPPAEQEQPMEQKKMTRKVQTKPTSPSSASMAKVIAANVAAPTSVPVPEMDVTDPAVDFGASNGLGDDWGSGGFTDGGGAGGGGMFGSPTGPGLKGSFYDLKQDPSGEPTEMGLQAFEAGGKFEVGAPVNRRYDEVLARAVRQNLDDGALSKYFKAPRELRLTQLYIPNLSAEEAPKSFEIGDRVKGRRWGIIYRGKVTVPEDGRYRFVGFADDILVVLVNKREVLDGSLAKFLDDADERDSFQQENTINGWKTYQGRWLNLDAGEQLDLAVLIGERPGGHFLGFLQIEKDGVEYAKDSLGAAKLPLFKMAPGPAPSIGRGVPPLAPDTAWSIWPSSS